MDSLADTGLQKPSRRLLGLAPAQYDADATGCFGSHYPQTARTMIFLLAGKLDFRTINQHAHV